VSARLSDRPGVRSCRPSPDVQSTEHADRVGKDELEELLHDSGLDLVSQREAARQLGCDEKTLRRWRHPECGLDLAPQEIRVLLRGLAVQRLRILRAG
jgi:hypothetical protein